ncbi:subtilisin protease [Melampsora larici-populina 98AG31]|uniref:Subtilisin protease n=1 Tax=Melampsora larici-populina (strain 98AG31 / pathotype 3-4-7) TaxID=747676 RepID=F4RXM4_MELLP|nr:subtilisin protease [Melampsora larici-populina 98AG31]EGG02868.1 subtilisin protease [Melampsora larici-populina 98AG31]
MAPHKSPMCRIYALFVFLYHAHRLLASFRHPNDHKDLLIVEMHSEDDSAFSKVSDYLTSEGIDHEVVNDMSSIAPNIIRAATIRLEDPQHLEKVKLSPSVKRVTSVQRIHISKPLKRQVLSQSLERFPPDNFGPHVQTRVADLHRSGIYGRGVKIAVLDDGIDCGHPAFGGGFGPGFKVSFGYDFVGDAFNFGSSALPSTNPCTECAMHGTHTSGIISASNQGYGFDGVAPNASLGMYRVLGCDPEGGTRNDIVVAAFLRAFKDGADIISASIGGPGGWSKGDVLSDTINNLAQKGVVLVLAGGNEGTEGLFFAERPAAATGSISVGSVQASTTIVTNLLTSTGEKLLYHTAGRFNGSDFLVYATSTNLDNESDACSPLGADTPNLSKYVVLIKRGTCPFRLKVAHVLAKGARRVLFYMDRTNMVTLETYMQGVSVASITNEDASHLVAQSRHKNFTVSFPQLPHFFVSASDAGHISSFSQYGPSYDFKNLQPDLLGVGGNVVSTVPRRSGSYASMSGSSMATPQVAGIIALIFSARGERWNSSKTSNLLATTSQLIMVGSNKDEIVSAIHQGAGLVDAYCAALSQTFLSRSSIPLEDSKNFQSKQSITITNAGSKTYTFKIKHRPAQTLPTFTPGSYHVATSVTPMTDHTPASVKMNLNSFKLFPGTSRTVHLTFEPPRGLNKALLPVYSGYISFISEAECESHNVPYYGVYGVMKEQIVIDRSSDTQNFTGFTLPRITDNTSKALSNGSVSFQGVNSLILRYRLAFGTPYLRTDLVSGDAKLDGIAKKSKKKLAKPKNSALVQSTFRGIRIIGMLPDSNSTYNCRTAHEDTEVLSWDGSLMSIQNLSSTITAPNGDYKILFRALKVNGDPNQDADWEAWLSPVIHINRAN